MPLITIDFWNTLVDNANGEARAAERFAALSGAIALEGHNVGEEELRAAFKGIWAYFDHHWLERQRTPTALEMAREICSALHVPLSDEGTCGVVEVFEQGILRHRPNLLPGLGDALEELASRAHLALISDTAFSPGRILRELMEEYGIARHFSAFVFSDETGVAKPHPEAFRHAFRLLQGRLVPHERAIHIGDIERTDIVGAKSAGMRAILSRGDEGRVVGQEEGSTVADAVVDHWDLMVEAVERLWA